MLLLATNALPTTRRLRAPDWYGRELGRLLTPRHYSAAGDTVAEAIPVAADNDCFQGLDEPAFLGMLEALMPVAGELLFATAPDVVGDADATLERWARWAPRLRRRGFRPALVLQDGMTIARLPADAEALFIGGSTEWKLGPEAAAITAHAAARGVWVHMGRVNSYTRARYALELGCASVDGSGWARFKTAMQPRWARLMAEVSAQALEEEVA